MRSFYVAHKCNTVYNSEGYGKMIMKYSEYGLVAYIKLLFKHSLKRMKKTTINLNKYSRN